MIMSGPPDKLSRRVEGTFSPFKALGVQGGRGSLSMTSGMVLERVAVVPVGLALINLILIKLYHIEKGGD